ncbi:hypothetical protein QWY77_02670 [Thalassotalea ponticola]|uniref:hypothetical protein n=1 Tax=Thalassotalea ponticola TaxID=1523392 RepID=UPI0025B5E607|nr:hypothetical protein [Thalassotalea ponticola]MDN3651668.1 hypothetical protein [Thalassotalea ponticola]
MEVLVINEKRMCNKFFFSLYLEHNNKDIMRILIVFMSLLCLSGCVGLAIGTFGTYELQKDSFGFIEGRLNLSQGEQIPYSKEEVVSLWGQPDKTDTIGNCEVFTYHDGYSWSGVGAFVIIVPIPLLVPSGNSETKVYFKNNQSVKLISEYGEVTGLLGYMCGSNECQFNAGPVNLEVPRTIPITWCE